MSNPWKRRTITGPPLSGPNWKGQLLPGVDRDSEIVAHILDEISGCGL